MAGSIVKLADGVHDENPFLNSQDGNNSQDIAVFRVLHRSPVHQKMMRTAVNTLRADHVAVSAYTVTAKREADVEVNIQGCHQQGRLDSVKLLSLENFIRVGANILKKEFGVCQADAMIRYSFSGVSMPNRAHSNAACLSLTKVVNANAYPGPWEAFTTTSSTPQHDIDTYEPF